ncbi:hypothetical protein EDD21DRAFT_88668 [Dissophora ornata]|nr:hypothetical protein EDD21DRAFT_88668 [Dissophora ornata]
MLVPGMNENHSFCSLLAHILLRMQRRDPSFVTNVGFYRGRYVVHGNSLHSFLYYYFFFFASTQHHKTNPSQAFIGFKDSKWNMRFPCGGYAPGPVTNMKAGDTVNVRFFASGMKAADIKKQPKPTSPSKQFSQARHGGGMVKKLFFFWFWFFL